MKPILPEEVNWENVLYLPHHAVLREDITTIKVRVVFDASCLGKNVVSLSGELVGDGSNPTRWFAAHWIEMVSKFYLSCFGCSENVPISTCL